MCAQRQWGVSDDEAFQRAVEPFVVAMLDLVEQTQHLRLSADYIAAPESIAMTERDAEHEYAGSWGKHPATDAHSLSWLHITTAENLIASMAALFRHPAAHVFGPVVLGRAALEACGRAMWLAEPKIGIEARIARGMTERMYSLYESARVAGNEHADYLRTRRESILAEAAARDFKKVSHRGQHVVSLQERRPGSTAIVRLVLDDGPQDDFGGLLYGYWSAICHSTLYGAVANMDPDPKDDHVGPLRRGAQRVGARDVVLQIAVIVFAYVRVAQAHADLFGWRSDALARSITNTFRHIASALETARLS